mmetsp:Transcript_7509/g.23180  ORF Transcript_7509/g.23180 Transcript_7509/m.23180 type:complete len:84 (+) Transcript_7509:565-816(+)
MKGSAGHLRQRTWCTSQLLFLELPPIDVATYETSPFDLNADREDCRNLRALLRRWRHRLLLGRRRWLRLPRQRPRHRRRGDES